LGQFFPAIFHSNPSRAAQATTIKESNSGTNRTKTAFYAGRTHTPTLFMISDRKKKKRKPKLCLVKRGRKLENVIFPNR
jgi:hypothetical protein